MICLSSSYSRSPDSVLPAEDPVVPTKTKEKSVWRGFVDFPEVVRFVSVAYKVSGPTEYLTEVSFYVIEIVGNINKHKCSFTNTIITHFCI